MADPRLPSTPRSSARSPLERSLLGTLLLVCAAIGGLFALDTFLAGLERADAAAEARRLFAAGRRLAAEGRNRDAAERFRAALGLARGERTYQLALARALLAAGRPAAADTVLAELLAKDATDGPANLMMARVLRAEGQIPRAVSYYHRAIYGRWSGDAAPERVRARFELIELLAQREAPKELLAELLAAEIDAPADLRTRKWLGRLFIQAGSPARAADLFRAILRKHPGDADAYAGIGEAQFAMGNYRAARANLQQAARLDPGNSEIRARLAACEEVLALDPLQRGLGLDQQYRRSLRLVELALDTLENCVGPTPPASVQALADSARRRLRHPARAAIARREPDGFESNLDLAERLWELRTIACGRPAGASRDPLGLVLAKIAQ